MHEHNSVPFDVESGKASLDFKPSDLEVWQESHYR